MSKIKTFIIHYNRPTFLERQLEILTKHPDLDIIVVDNYSHIKYSDQITAIIGKYKVQCLPLPENFGHQVVWAQKLSKHLVPVNENYIVTDCDILPPENVDYVKILADGLDKYPKVNKVALELNISRIPDEYPRRAEVVNHEKRYVHRENIKKEKDFILAPVDTTFAMYRGGYHNYSVWGREDGEETIEVKSLRTKNPKYEATHLGWHIWTPYSEEMKFYFDSIKNTNSGHWKL